MGSNLAREAGRLYQWKEKFWGRRYQAIVVSNEVEAQISRLAYLLSHGAKEGLVERPQEWPGAHSVTALLTGEPLEGLWFDRMKEYAARRRGEDFDRLKYATVEAFTLDPLPCWSALSEDLYRKRIASLLAEIEAMCPAAKQGNRAPRPRGDLVPGPARQTPPFEEVACPSLSRFPQERPPRAIPSLRLVRSRIS